MAFKIASFEIVGNSMLTFKNPDGSKSPGWAKPPLVMRAPSFAGLTAVAAKPLELDGNRIAIVQASLVGKTLQATNITNAKSEAKDEAQKELNKYAKEQLYLVGEAAGYKPLGGGIHSIGVWLCKDTTTPFEIPYTEGTLEFVIYASALMSLAESP